MPIGIAISDPRPVRISVPTMAFAMPPPGFADRLRHVREEVEVERLDALADDEEQDERQRHQREQHRQRAEADEQRRQQPCGGVVRLMRAASAGAGVGDARLSALRAMLQISRRDSELTISVMMNSTRPISTSACR